MSLVALGVMLDGNRLSACSWKALASVANISAPKLTVIMSAQMNLVWWTPDNSGLSAVMAVGAPL